jgi:hypothetical protein
MFVPPFRWALENQFDFRPDLILVHGPPGSVTLRFTFFVAGYGSKADVESATSGHSPSDVEIIFL